MTASSPPTPIAAHPPLPDPAERLIAQQESGPPKQDLQVGSFGVTDVFGRVFQFFGKASARHSGFTGSIMADIAAILRRVHCPAHAVELQLAAEVAGEHFA